MNDKDVVICRCEGITLEQIKQTLETHQCSSREIKLRTRAGMGSCGGRTCRSLIDRVVAEMGGEVTPDQIPLSYRPPVRPVTFGVLARNENDGNEN